MMQKLRDNTQRAKLAEIFIWISAGVSLLIIMSTIYTLFLQYKWHNNEISSLETLANNVYIEAGVYILNLIVYIISAITFILWFRRAYYNQEVKFEYMSLTNGWAVGAWFVPILNLYRPYQMMRELFEEAENYLVKKNLDSHKKSRFRILGCWWFLWIFLGFAEALNARIMSISVSYERLLILNSISIIIDLLCIVMAFLTIKFIRDYNHMEQLILSNSSSAEIEIKKDSDLLDSHF